MLYLCAMLGCAAMVMGPAYNDYVIGKDPGRGIATVTGVTSVRTYVEYQDDQGSYHFPQTGLLYPSGLGEGQQVWVTYARSKPDLVKVEGRTWTLSIIPALSVAVVSTVVAALAWFSVSSAFAPRKADEGEGSRR
ncbi:DUF3592 domain-containing protein [Corynebacterium aquatimens]|nr:DUF3592 domain-containing protein [Corynebacterium aquatimens]